MPTTTTPLFYRWCDAMRQRLPELPEELLTLCYAGLEAGRGFTQDEIAEALHCDREAATSWHSVAVVWLLNPALYVPLFEAEDALADCRARRTAFLADCKALDDRLASLDEQIAVSKNYALLSAAHAAEMAPKIQTLATERADLLRALDRDVPRQRELLADEEHAVQERFWRVQEGLHAAFEAQVTAVQQSWLTAILERCEPILELLRRARSLDEAGKALGRPGSLGGTMALRQAVLRLVQEQG
jgi:hypothetical protein